MECPRVKRRSGLLGGRHTVHECPSRLSQTRDCFRPSQRGKVRCRRRRSHSSVMLMRQASIICRDQMIRVLVSAITLFGAVQVCAQDLDTRAGRLQRERQAKSQQLAPYKRNGLESLLFELKDRRIMERYQAGYKGFHPMLGGLADRKSVV